MIRAEHVSFRYPGAVVPALDDVSLEVPDGEMLVVAGASGSGKSTLAHALVGIVPHLTGGDFEGTVVAYGRDTRENRPRDLSDVVGFVAQEPESQGVTEHVEDEIVFAMENLGVAPVMMRKRLEEVLDALGIAALRGRKLSSLSGGERQRVAIAAVLAAQPRCVILDEPTSQLDPQSAEDVLGALHRLNTDLGLTVVCVEHRLERVAQHADRIVVLRDGRVVAEGTPRDVLAGGEVATPLSRLGRALGWSPLPLTVREGRAHATASQVKPSPREHEPREITAAPIVEARGLRVALGGVEILRGVDLAIAPGETVAIVGRNGAGKTTLLRALVGLARPHAGRRRIGDLDPGEARLEQLAAHVAYVPQSPGSILFHESVVEEVRFTFGARAKTEAARDVVERAGLGAYADLDPRDLSSGQRLRVAILAATARARDAILLDEPTRGMDEEGKEDLVRTMHRWREQARAVALVTHDVELIARAATRVVLLAQGVVVLDGPVHEVLGESALFSSQMNKVFGDRRILTVEDALHAVGVSG